MRSTWRPGSRRPLPRARSCSAPRPTLWSATTWRTSPFEPLTVKGKAEPVPAWRLEAVAETVGRRQRPLEAAWWAGVARSDCWMTPSARRSRSASATCSRSWVPPGWASRDWSRSSSARIDGSGSGCHRRCLAYGRGITYWPVVEAIRMGLGIVESEPARYGPRSPGGGACRGAEADRVADIAGNLLGLIDAGAGLGRDLLGHSANVRGHGSASASRPRFDDIHWGEATFLDLIEHIADWTRDAPDPAHRHGPSRAAGAASRLGRREAIGHDHAPRAAVRGRERRAGREPARARRTCPPKFADPDQPRRRGQPTLRRGAPRQAHRRRFPGRPGAAGLPSATCASWRSRRPSRRCWRPVWTAWAARSGPSSSGQRSRARSSIAGRSPSCRLTLMRPRSGPAGEPHADGARASRPGLVRGGGGVSVPPPSHP